MLPYSNKNTFDYENNCSYGDWRISLMNKGIGEKAHGDRIKYLIESGRLSLSMLLHEFRTFLTQVYREKYL